MASGTPNRFRYDLMKGTHGDLTAITIKAMLLKPTYTFNPDHKFVSDVKTGTDYECSGTGYTRQTLASKTLTQDDTLDRCIFDAADITFTGINAGTIGYILLLRDRGGADSANEILMTLDPPDLITSGADVTVVWNTAGIYAL